MERSCQKAAGFVLCLALFMNTTVLATSLPDLPRFPAVAELPTNKVWGVVIEFDGASLSKATGAVFAVSPTPDLPAQWRPLFPDGQDTWDDTYRLPALRSVEARHLFIGLPEAVPGHPARQLTVLHYALGIHGRIRLSYCPQRLPACPSLAQDGGASLLTPEKTLHLPMAATTGTPWFDR